MLHSTREYQMSRNMNTRRSLYIICLLLLSAVGNKLDAQTVVKSVRQANDSTNHALIHQIGFDVRPGYVAPTNSFLEGDNAQRQKIDRSLSLHLKYAFQFSKDSYLGGCILMPIRASVFRIIHFIIPLNWKSSGGICFSRGAYCTTFILFVVGL